MWLFYLISQLVMADSSYSMRFELGLAQNIKNEFQIPSNSGTLFDLERNNTLYGRWEGLWNWDQKNSLRLVVSPFEIEEDYSSASPFTFDGQAFLANIPSRVGFKFNSYRLSYLRHFSWSEALSLTLGGTLKIRDAHIFVEQNGVQEKYTDFGFVPLLYLGLNYQWAERWTFVTNVDGAGSPQGYAIDALIEAQYHYRDKTRLGLGWRFLDGGADNDKVKNFATIYYWLVSATHYF